MKVFIAGGTGVIGSLLVDELLSKGHEVTILTRDKNKVNAKWQGRVSSVEGLVTEKGDWQSKVSGHDGIVNLVGEHIFKRRWTKKRKEKLYTSRVNSSENLQWAAKNAEIKPNVFVGISGSDYYPMDNDKVFTESDPPGNSFLAKLCENWEKGVIDLSDQGIRGVILRFGVGFTRSGTSAELMFLPHKFFVGGWVGSGKQPLSWIHVVDMVGSIIWALESEVSGVFNSAGPEHVTFKEAAKIGGKVMGRWTWTWAPGFMLKILLGERADTILKGRYLSVEKIQANGYVYKFPNIKEALEDIL